MNSRLERGAHAAAGMRAVVEPIAAHWQDEQLWLELVSDPKTRDWSVHVYDRRERRARRHLGLDQALGVLACRAHGAVRPFGLRDV
ncbi:MAG: hypothetical protein MZV65_12270 [Chromatiales bacterium]|nr:hypothetical protein [Chromatiales bacterium]